MLSASFDGMTVADAMRPTPEAVSGRSTIAAVLDLYAIGPRLKSLPVELDGRVVGVIGQDEIEELRGLAETCTHEINWQDGDIAVLDNTRVMHGRRAIVDTNRQLFIGMGNL
jgi:hypothetical protein